MAVWRVQALQREALPLQSAMTATSSTVPLHRSVHGLSLPLEDWNVPSSAQVQKQPDISTAESSSFFAMADEE